MLPAARRSRHSSLAALVVSSFMSAILVFAVVAVAQPGEVLGATLSKVALCNANLRTRPATSAPAKKVITTGTRVTANLRLVGGSWRVTCAGKTSSGKFWYRISAINGRSVKSLYGVTYLYGVSALFKPYPTPVTKYAACGAYLRTSAATTARSRVLIKTDTKVTVAASVTGGSWSWTCAGKALSGKYWYRISAINGKSVQTLYGVTYLYAPSGLFKPTITTTSSTPTPAPRPRPRRPRLRARHRARRCQTRPKASTSVTGRTPSIGPRSRPPARSSPTSRHPRTPTTWTRHTSRTAPRRGPRG